MDLDIPNYRGHFVTLYRNGFVFRRNNEKTKGRHVSCEKCQETCLFFVEFRGGEKGQNLVEYKKKRN